MLLHAEGYLTQNKPPLGNATDHSYDKLNRLVQTTQPAATVGGTRPIIQFSYNGQDDLIQVKDPRNLSTTYTPDGLSNAGNETSPDRGTTTRTFDAAGNMLTSKDAKNQTTTYTYDALNRVTKATFQDGSYYTYGYDSFSTVVPINYGKGRLTRISEFNSTGTSMAYVQWRYDQLGHVIEDTRAINGKTFVTSYSYAPSGSGSTTGHLTQMTYPSGRVVNYSYNSLGQVSSISTTASSVVTSGTGAGTQTLLSSATYFPFGGVSGFSFGSGETYARTQDLSGRIDSFTLGMTGTTPNKYNITFDANDRPTKIALSGSTTLIAGFGYDLLDRLNSNTLPGLSIAYSYDLSGNRLSLTRGSSATTYTISPTSNRITQTTNGSTVKTITTDANGSITDDGTNTFVYNAAGRMSSSTSSVGTTTYYVSALGQRMRKTNATLGDFVFVYGLDGSLLSEDPINTSATTQPIRETVYLNGMPVAHFIETPSGTNRIGEVFYVHNDHLNTPRLLTDKIKNPRWAWSPVAVEAFGGDVANEQPTAGQAIVKFDLRFPGQVFTKETGLFYNYFRDGYNAAWGRYEEFDPIGMFGGSSSPYAYVNDAPTMFTDPTGLNPALALPVIEGIGQGITTICSRFPKACGAAVMSVGAAITKAFSSKDENKDKCEPCSNNPSRTEAFLAASTHAGVNSSWHSIGWDQFNKPRTIADQKSYTSFRQSIGNDPYGYRNPANGGEVVEHPADGDHPCPHFHAKSSLSGKSAVFPYNPAKP